MKVIRLSNPPNPTNALYRGDLLAYSKDLNLWNVQTKNFIENASRQNDAPLQQNFVVSSFTTNTALTGTSTGTDLANFLCSLVQSMIDKGFITITTSTGI